MNLLFKNIKQPEIEYVHQRYYIHHTHSQSRCTISTKIYLMNRLPCVYFSRF